ncbi:putative reverse transcriptase domain-containing protein, partial [Tanacetum coccineum]
MTPTTRRGPNTPVNNTNPNNMTPESIQAMIDQALLRNSTNGDGSHSVVGLTRWIEKMESVFNISGCATENQVKFATCTLLGAALTWWNGERKPYGGSLPKCTKSTGNTNVANTQKGNGVAHKGNGCFECGAPGHFKRDWPKLKNKDGGNGNAQGWVYAVKNAEK